MAGMDKIQTVSEFLRLLRGKINNAFGMVWVGGEVSNCVRAASGHFYFSVKDGSSQIRCVFFKFKARGSESIGLRDGIEVEVFAKTTIYEPRGDLQLVVEGIRLAGKGRLFQEYQTLKLKLQKEGLFNAERKKNIPVFPNSIGVVTSEKGAALIDVLAVLKKRMPSIAVIIYPTRVQGDGAAVEIRNSLKLALSRSEVDVLIICRGGGSFEDLWPFNDESLARAVVESHIPIVSGIGHATDFTILDFVADANATTPTAAAAAVSPNYDDLILDLNKFKRSMLRVIENIIEQKVQLIDFIGQRLASPSEKATKRSSNLGFSKTN